MKDKTKIAVKAGLFLLVILALSIILWQPFHAITSSKESTQDFLNNFGNFSAFGFIFITALQVMLAPIPGQFIGLASGYLFGPLLGTILSMTGLIIGSSIVFWLSRRYGRPFVEVFVKKSTLNKIDKKIERHGVKSIFMFFLLPALPDDALCFIVGLTKIPIPTLIIISAIGRLPGFIVLNFVGDIFASNNFFLAIIVFSITMLISLIAFIYREKIEKAMMIIVCSFRKCKR